MTNVKSGVGCIQHKESKLYLKFTEVPEPIFCIEWRQASIVPAKVWFNDEEREKIINYHELTHVRNELRFVPFIDLVFPEDAFPED